MASVYATDDPQGKMPSFSPSESGGNPTDVSTNFLSNLTSFGFNVPMFFCPVRPADLDAANAWFYVNGRPSHTTISSVAELNQYFTSPTGRSVNGGYAKLFHDWWVPRQNSGAGGLLFPVPNGPNQSAPPGALPWPSKQTDFAANQQPIVSDLAEASGSTTNVANIPSSSAHFTGNNLSSINVGYADGHVATHTKSTISWQFSGNSGAQSYFY
jgi:prepilin-type processing-associated H-X9-DG protein